MTGPTADPVLDPALALGIDAGGSATRWALADTAGAVLAEGRAPPFGRLQLLDAEGGRAFDAALEALASALPARPKAAWAGVTGLDAAQTGPCTEQLAAALGLDRAAIHAASDIELLCRAAGVEPVVLYAGTGSIAAWLSPHGLLERSGEELARLVHALWRRVGPRKVVFAGGVFALDPQVERSLRAALPVGTVMHPLATPPHPAAARLAAATLSMPPPAGAPRTPAAPTTVAR
jgi:N-acetylglucosamine kinase-like BadF-type ATPase